MSETPNGQLADGSLRCWIYGRDPFPEWESVPIFSTPTREQIFLITASSLDLVQVTWGCGSHCDPAVKMARRPEIVVAAERLKSSFGELWGSREFLRPKQPPGPQEEIDGHIFHIYDLFYSAYGWPDRRRVDLHEKSEPLEDLNQSESPRDFAMKRLYVSAAADKMFSPLENPERLSKIEAAARRLLDLVATECSPAFLWGGDGTTPLAESGGNLEAAAEPMVVLGEFGDEPRVNGRKKVRLTLPQFHVLTALMEAGEIGLSQDELKRDSGHGDPVNTLKRLAKADGDWHSVIRLAGRPGGRYRLLSK